MTVPQLYTLKTVQQALGVSRDALRRAQDRGALAVLGKVTRQASDPSNPHLTLDAILYWLANRKIVNSRNNNRRYIFPTVLDGDGHPNPAAVYMIQRALWREAAASTEPAQQALNEGCLNEFT